MIEINNLTRVKVNENLLKKIACDILKNEKKQKFDLSIALVSPAEITKLNKYYLKKATPTDVLAFPQNLASQKPILPDTLNALGEIVICPQQVKNNSKDFHRSFEEQLSRTLIHGILHLLGYNHEGSKKKAAQMDGKESYYLKKYFLKKSDSKK